MLFWKHPTRALALKYAKSYGILKGTAKYNFFLFLNEKKTTFNDSTHIALGLDGVEFIVNASGSYFELRKANVAVDLVLGATRKSGGCYLFNNLRGCDGQRVLFNGGSCISLNGEMISRTRQFSLEEVVSILGQHKNLKKS